MFKFKTTSGRISWTMLLNYGFMALWFVNYFAYAIGFGAYEPPDDVAAFAAVLLAFINILLRRWHTTEPIN